MSDEIDELEKLAKEFIIGYVPLTDKQKNLTKLSSRLQRELDVIEIRKKRVIKMLNAVEDELINSFEKTRKTGKDTKERLAGG